MAPDMNEIFMLYTLIYVVVSFCYVFRSSEFISAGLSIEHMFGSLLGQEIDDFINYHKRKICLTILVYSLLPSGFIVGLILLNIYPHFIYLFGLFTFQLLILFSTISILAVLCLITYWSINNWINHPVIKNILPFCSSNQWSDIAQQINDEYKRIEKLVLQCGPRTKLIVTENWIILIGMTDVEFAHQDDSELLVYKENTHYMTRTINTTDDFHDSINSIGITQYLDIRVRCPRKKSPFIVRINALDFKDLKGSLKCPLRVLPNVVFYQTKIDMFLELFEEIVRSNPVYNVTNIQDTCAGCLSATADVKLVKLCNDTLHHQEDTHCWPCKCRPMWCTSCMGRWFASRQDQRDTSNWLSSKCTCPMCRATFCMLDVCPIQISS